MLRVIVVSLLLLATRASAMPVLFEVGLEHGGLIEMSLDYDTGQARIIGPIYGLDTDMLSAFDPTGLEAPDLPGSLSFSLHVVLDEGSMFEATYDADLTLLFSQGQDPGEYLSHLYVHTACCFVPVVTEADRIAYVRPVPEPALLALLFLAALGGRFRSS